MNQVIGNSVHAEQNLRTSDSFKTYPITPESAGGMNNNGWRRFRRNGIVPQAVLSALRQSGTIKKDAWIFARETTVGELLEFLKCYPYESEQASSAGDHLFRKIFKTEVPVLANEFSQGDDIWIGPEISGLPITRRSTQ